MKQGEQVHLISSMLGADEFVAGAIGAAILSLVQAATTFMTSLKRIFEKTIGIIACLLLYVLFYTAAGGVLAYILSLNSPGSAFVTGLTAIGFFSYFISDPKSQNTTNGNSVITTTEVE